MTTLTPRLFGSRGELDAALAERLGRAIAAPGTAALMLSGGTTPMPAYRALAGQPLAHDERLHVLFSDDRYVPADSTASNFHQSRTLIDALGLPPESLLRVRTELPLA
ncbi:MAG TPA: 6-phosphogluconolactonase, partial [Steroidobacteraceae bacterium]|nr:6-phosphogluconolactonase [Steroidobacteraceae bacterium]